MNHWRLLAVLLASFAFAPAAASAQATLAGTVKDASGGVLPGVTVEAASPVLLEKVRTAVTDGSGLFRLPELPPGPYSLTFTLPGFSTVKRDGIVVTGLQVATVDVDLRVGDINETITVTGEAPVVDVQSARRGEVLQEETLKSLPATRGYNAIVLLVPSVTGMTNQIDLAPTMRNFSSQGGRSQEGRVTLDGLNTGAGFNTGGVSFYMLDTGGAQEMNVTLTGALGESEVGGPTVNVVPKTGGNVFSGQLFGSGSGKWSQGDNIDDTLKAYGITQVPGTKSWDASVSVGGPILRDRLWFYGTARNVGAYTDVLGMYANKNAGDPTKWTYDKDPGVRALEATAKQVAAMRLTAQVTPRNKVGVYYDYQFVCNGSALVQDAGVCRSRQADWIAGGTATASPEAAFSGANNGYLDSYQRMTQVSWTSPVSNKLLLDAGYSGFFNRYGPQKPPGAILNLNQVTEQRSLPNADGTFAPANLIYRALDAYNSNALWNQNWRASMSYVTGSHEMKFGYQGVRYGWDRHFDYNDTRVNYIFNNAQPVALLMNVGAWDITNITAWGALYAQDQWRFRRLSLQAAVRYDRAWSWAPEEGNGATGPDRFHAQAITFPYTEGVHAYNDITPRFGLAYDVFGNGKTALKVNAGKYLRAAANDPPYISNNPALNFQRTTQRAWNDGNRDFVPDCDLMNPALNNECGPWLSPAFGNRLVPVTLNPEILGGWGVREYDKKFGVAVQQQLFPGTSIEVEYNRRWYGNFQVVDNRAVGPQDFDRFTVTVPQHPELPGGGGYQLTYVDPRVLTQNMYQTRETDYAPARTQYWHGGGATVNMRPRAGLALQGGFSTGRGVWDYCALYAVLPELSLVTLPAVQREPLEGCSGVEPFLQDFRGSASYNVPKVDVLVTAAIQNKPGTLGQLVGMREAASNGMWMGASVFTPNSTIQQSLGRLPTGQTSPTGTTTLNALLPAQKYGDRVNQIDMRISKRLQFGRTRTLVGVDVYNLLNTNAALTYNQAFAANWPRPTQILLPRLMRLNATIDF